MQGGMGWDGSRTAVLMEASYAHCTTVGTKQLPLYKQVHFDRDFPRAVPKMWKVEANP